MIPGGPFGQQIDQPPRDSRWLTLQGAATWSLGQTALQLPATQPFLNHDFPIPPRPRQPIYDWQAGLTALSLPVTQPVLNHDFPVPPRPRFPAPAHTEGATAGIIPPFSAGPPFAVLTPIIKS